MMLLPAEVQKTTILDDRRHVHQGVEKGCIILVAADGQEYSLHGKSLPTLDKGLGVSAKGKAGGVDFCMQGTPFAVSSWTWTKKECPKNGK